MDSGLKSDEAYRASLDALFARTGSTSKFGLERTHDLLAQLGNPHERIKTLHVAGTNGKGSVVATLCSLLRAKGLKVGRYMSPHLVDFSERIVIDDRTISPEYIVDFLKKWDKPTKKLGATFFEITTAMALDYFANNEVDVAVIETGLGGRLDSTNVITPMVAGITSIAIDHQEFLGDTIEEIAREKAGIFKAGIPSVIGDMSTEARVAIYQSAAESGVGAVVDATRVYRISDVSVSRAGTTFKVKHGNDERHITTGLVGAAQANNAAVALAMLRFAGGNWAVTLDEAAATLPSVQLPGRFQQFGRFVVDVAHNPDGMLSLITTLEEVASPQPIVAILGVLRDKDWRQMMDLLAPAVERIVIVAPPSAPPDRAWDPSDALSYAIDKGINASVDLDFERALATVPKDVGTILVVGSFHTAGDALKLFGLLL